MAHARGRGDGALLGIARRFADHVAAVFGPGRRRGTPGHPEVETALVKLSRLTGDRRYLDLASFFVDERGHGTLRPATFGASYFPDHDPVRQQRERAGHAVRARMWSWRVLLATGAARYADLIERTLDNGFLAGLALDGSGYSYVNPLQVRDEHHDPVERGARRQSWYECACCPPNVMRLPASLHHHVATADAGGLQVHQYASGRHASDRPSAGPVAVAVSTGYAWAGRVEVEVVKPGEGDWTLSLRVPGWPEGARLSLGGSECDPGGPGGHARVRRRWARGDHVVLEFAHGPRLLAPHPRIDAVRGCVAIERASTASSSPTPPPAVASTTSRSTGRRRSGTSRGRTCSAGSSRWRPAVATAGRRAAAGRTHRPAPEPRGFADDGAAGAAVTLTAVPYALWGNRGDGAMRVWTPAAPR